MKHRVASICAWRACQTNWNANQQHESAGESHLAAAHAAQQSRTPAAACRCRPAATAAGIPAVPNRYGHRRGKQPEKHRRLVGVEVAADARDEPVARPQHVLRDQRKARLVRRPRIAQAEPGDRSATAPARRAREQVARYVAAAYCCPAATSGRVATRATAPFMRQVSSWRPTRGDARRISHITPNMSTMPTQSRLFRPYFDVPLVRSR